MKEIEKFIEGLEKEGLIEATFEISEKKVLYRNGKLSFSKPLSKKAVYSISGIIIFLIISSVFFLFMKQKPETPPPPHQPSGQSQQPVHPKPMQEAKTQPIKPIIKPPQPDLQSQPKSKPIPMPPSPEPIPFPQPASTAVVSALNEGTWKLYLIKSNGEELLIRELTAEQRHPSVSRDSKLLVFQKDSGQNARVCIYNLQERQTISCNIPGEIPAISPDGRKIIYKPLDFKTNKRLEIVHINRKHYRTMDILELDDVKSIAFLNDSKKIVFVGVGKINYHGNVYMYNLENGNLEVIANGTRSREYDYVTASLSGNKLMMTANQKIFTLNYEDKTASPQLMSEISGLFPKFSIDNQKIYYLDIKNKKVKIYNIGG